MTLHELIRTEILKVVPAVYWYQAPPNAPSLYAVIDVISDVASYAKQELHQGMIRKRIQVTISGTVQSEVAAVPNALRRVMRTVKNLTGTNCTWYSAHPMVQTEAYSAPSKRFVNTHDFELFYNETEAI